MKFIRTRTKHAWGVTNWEYRIHPGLDFDEIAQEIHDEHDYSDKYRGCDIEDVEPADLPEGWVENRIAGLHRHREHLTTMIEELENLS